MGFVRGKFVVRYPWRSKHRKTAGCGDRNSMTESVEHLTLNEDRKTATCGKACLLRHDDLARRWRWPSCVVCSVQAVSSQNVTVVRQVAGLGYVACCKKWKNRQSLAVFLRVSRRGL